MARNPMREKLTCQKLDATKNAGGPHRQNAESGRWQSQHPGLVADEGDQRSQDADIQAFTPVILGIEHPELMGFQDLEHIATIDGLVVIETWWNLCKAIQAQKRAPHQNQNEQDGCPARGVSQARFDEAAS